MAELIFDAAELRPIIRYTLERTEHTPTFAQMFDPEYLKPGRHVPEDGFPSEDDIDMTKVGGALHLVKDRGIYLMSSARERDITEDGSSRVCYAHGANPTRDPDWYEFAVDAVGGDDFVEALPIADFQEVLDDESVTHVAIRVTQDTLEVGLVRR